MAFRATRPRYFASLWLLAFSKIQQMRSPPKGRARGKQADILGHSALTWSEWARLYSSGMRPSKWLPWQTQGFWSLAGILIMWSLMEAVRSGYYAVYLPLTAVELGQSKATIGVAYTLHYLSDSLARSLGGYLVGKFGLGPISLLASITGLLLIGVTPRLDTAIELWAFSLLWGLTLSGILPGLMTLSSRMAVKGREGRALAYTQAFTQPFIGLGFFGTNFLLERAPGAILDVFFAVLVVCTVCALPALLIRQHFHLPKQEFYPWQRLLLFIPAAFVQTFGLSLLTQVISPYARMLGITTLGLLSVVALGAVTSFFSTAWLGRIADRRGPKYPMIISAVCIALTMSLLAQRPTGLEMAAIALLGGLGLGMFGPSWNALVARILPQHNRAAVWGTLLTVEGMGVAIAPSIGSTLWTTVGVQAPFYFGAIIWLGLGVYYFFALRRLRWKLTDTQA